MCSLDYTSLSQIAPQHFRKVKWLYSETIYVGISGNIYLHIFIG